MNKNTTVTIIVVLAIIIIGGLIVANRAAAPADTTQETTNTPDAASNETSSPAPGSTGTTSTGTSVNVGGSASVSTGAVKSFTVTSSSFKFSPTEIRVKQGDKVRVTLNNTNGMHDFVIDEFNVKTKVIQGAGSDVVEFTADKKGTFEYYCSVGNHRQMGMVGKLIVE
jgi:cytochrome c oxidase subunit II